LAPSTRPARGHLARRGHCQRVGGFGSTRRARVPFDRSRGPAVESADRGRHQFGI